ncbi:50S ribosomal protein L6 [Candidatus Bathyarchaeota archaeon]|nr:MAG: 50S ribosomal protein L6 [Candidatus Bathyarchaeota archaeon]
MLQIVSRRVEIPEGVKVNIDGKRVEVIGEKGRLVRDFSNSPVSINIEDNQVVVYTDDTHRKTVAMVGTVCAHIRNMIKGVTEGFTYKLKIVYAHFPISVKVEGDKILIENFLGERAPRIAKIVGNTKVIVKKDDVILQGINIEEVGQTAANIEQATKIKNKDPRKFLDGIYVYEKHEGFEE